MIKNSPDSFPSEQSERYVDRTTRWTVRRHFCVNKTLEKVRERCYWLQARNDLGKWCRQCATCVANRGLRTRNRGQMHRYNVRAPFERIATDVAGPFPRSDEGNRYLLIAVDYFTKWPEA
jgi:hypothetical protein